MSTALSITAIMLAVVALSLAIPVIVRGSSSDRMTHAEALSYKGSFARADAERLVKQAHYDATGEHVWVEITAYGHTKRKVICGYCGTVKELDCSS